MHYNDWAEAGSEAACKAAGKYQMKGKDYIVEDGDIIFFKFNVRRGRSHSPPEMHSANAPRSNNARRRSQRRRKSEPPGNSLARANLAGGQPPRIKLRDIPRARATFGGSAPLRGAWRLVRWSRSAPGAQLAAGRGLVSSPHVDRTRAGHPPWSGHSLRRALSSQFHTCAGLHLFTVYGNGRGVGSPPLRTRLALSINLAGSESHVSMGLVVSAMGCTALAALAKRCASDTMSAFRWSIEAAMGGSRSSCAASRAATSMAGMTSSW